jgi:uncharacterized membrane protein YfcA
MFESLLFVGSVAAGAIASVAGFGVGSVLTPVFALRVDTRLAVAAVSIPHLAATSLRLWMMRRYVDWRLLRGFGLASAAGGLAGRSCRAASGAARWTSCSAACFSLPH